MLMRKTSAPASNRLRMTAWSEEAGPSVATTLVRRCRLIGFGFRRTGRGRCAGAGGWGGCTGSCTAAGGRGLFERTASRQRVLRRLLARFGELDGPRGLFAGIHLEEAGAVIAAGETITDAADREFPVAGAHKGLPHPFAAMIVVDGVDIIITRDEIALEHGFAAARRQIPPAFRGPAVGVLVADGDADPAPGIIAKAEIGRGRAGRCGKHHHG